MLLRTMFWVRWGLLVVLGALVVTRVAVAQSPPAPGDPIATAREFFRKDLASAEARYRNEHGKPFFFDHGRRTRVGALLIHGFTASSWEMEELGQYLYARGRTVYGVRLAGHGTSPAELKDTTWQAWVASADHGLQTLRAATDRVYAIGFSTGGLVALEVAAQGKVDGVVALAAAVKLRSTMARLAGPANLFKDYSFRDPPLPRELTPYYYEARPLRAVEQLVRFGDHVFFSSLSEITVPILIVQSRADDVVDPLSSELIHAKVKSAIKELRWIGEEEKTGHVITTFEYPSRAKVFGWVEEFIERLEKSGDSKPPR
jgi:carboxylesterase